MVLRSNFAVFRLPGKSNIEVWEFGEDKTDEKFVFHSFDNQLDKYFYPKNKQEFSYPEFEHIKFDLNLKDSKITGISRKKYIEKCNFFIKNLKQFNFQKLILSRIAIKEKFHDINKNFIRLCKKYPTAFVYLINFEDETWLGASPERLLQVENNQLKTVALAGTKSKSENRNWTEKELLEHQIVVDYIHGNLKEIKPQISTTETLDLGKIQHLKTEIAAHVGADFDVNKILFKLHPTPAVCGIPKDEAMEFILANEGYERRFYTGYFGIIAASKSEIFVNLRCAQLFKNQTVVYVGGGLLAASKAAAEWQETVLKSEALF